MYKFTDQDAGTLGLWLQELLGIVFITENSENIIEYISDAATGSIKIKKIPRVTIITIFSPEESIMATLPGNAGLEDIFKRIVQVLDSLSDGEITKQFAKEEKIILNDIISEIPAR